MVMEKWTLRHGVLNQMDPRTMMTISINIPIQKHMTMTRMHSMDHPLREHIQRIPESLRN